MEEQKKYQHHPVDKRYLTNSQPDGFADWFGTFSSTRAYSRAERELCVFQKLKSYDEGDYSHLRIIVYEGCFFARTWDIENADTVKRPRARRTFLEETPKIIEALIKSEDFLNTYPESNRIGSLVLDGMRNKGYTISKEGGCRSELPIIDMIVTLKEVLNRVDNSCALKPIIERMLFPAGGYDYLCFHYLGMRDLSAVKKPSRLTALTLYLSTRFRLHTDNDSPFLSNGFSIKALSKYGGPYWKQAATIALCALADTPPGEDEINRAMSAAKREASRYKKDENILITSWG